ncbi:hypothetical protein GCM10023086_68210 [Streptomyces venetus]|uniref:MarR family transcriptional regulator n=1 Tax=Streptomyces venetus TaxID=1701086 RepID=A0ABP8H7X8_9ACTN
MRDASADAHVPHPLSDGVHGAHDVQAERGRPLAEHTGSTLSRLSNMASRLEKRGWQRRRPDPADGRYTLATLTDGGMAKVAAAAPPTSTRYAASCSIRCPGRSNVSSGWSHSACSRCSRCPARRIRNRPGAGRPVPAGRRGGADLALLPLRARLDTQISAPTHHRSHIV